MHFLSFWKNWPPVYRNLWLLFAVIFSAAIVFTWANYIIGAEGVIDWEKIQEQKTIDSIIHSFRLGPFNLSVPAESYVILEYLSGGDVTHNFTATHIFLFIFFFSIIVLLAISTTLDRLWYFVSTSLFIVIMVILRMDVLLLFGMEGMVIPVTVMALFVLASFYFKYFNTSSSFTTRFLTFLTLGAIVGLCILFFAEATYPSLHLMVTAYIPALIISILFVLIVAHEIMVAFAYISHQGREASGPKHFSIISALYLLYILLTCLHEIGVIDWGLIYMNIYLLLTISAILGVWGYRLREPVYENLFSFQPLGSFFYLAMGSICFATIGQLFGNWNDSALEIINDLTIFAHVGFGIIFLTYFFSNFLAMMSASIPVYPLIYKPNRMPYFTFRFAGLIVTLAFVFYSQWRDYVHHGVAGFYNYVADLYLVQGDERIAMSFYDQSTARSFQSNRPNYVLGKMRSVRMDIERAKQNYITANGRRPTEFSLSNEGNIHFWTGNYFDAISSFRLSIEREPGSAALKNNLGYAFMKVHALDSASYYLNEARQETLTKNSAESNFLGMTAAELLPINTDSVLNVFDTDSRSVNANALALAIMFDQDVKTTPDPLSEKTLDLYSATYLHNYIVRNTKTLDTAWISQAFKIASDSMNLPYREALKASLAFAYYHKGRVYKALEILGELAYITQNYGGKFNYTMGLWALEQGDPLFAASYFTYADDADYKLGKFYRTIALTESGKIPEALQGWDSLAYSDDTGIRTLANQLRTILRVRPSQATSLPDGAKYQYCRYRLGMRDTVEIKRLAETFENVNYKGQVLLDLATKFYEADKLIPAIRFLSRTAGLQLTDKMLFDNIRFLELQMLASRREIRLLASQINAGVEFDSNRQLEKMLFTAVISDESADKETADKNFSVLARSNPFFEEGILSAASFYRSQDTTSLRPYEILTDAIYMNARSIRLVKAYALEAQRMGFDEYAASAGETLRELESKLR